MRYLVYSRLWALLLCLCSVYAVNAQIDILDKYNCNTWIHPINDLCEDATVVTANTFTAVTCCGAIENNIDHCGNMETGIWYLYNQSGEGTELTFTNLDATGPINIEIFTGDCNGLTLVEFSNCALFEQYQASVSNCDGQILIHIATKIEGCGAFEVSITDVQGCGAADNCDDIQPSHNLNPISDMGEDCLSSCLDFACSTTCQNPGVWFQVNTDNFATLLNLEMGRKLLKYPNSL